MKFAVLFTCLMISGVLWANERGNGGDSVRCDGKLRTLDSVIMIPSPHYTFTRSERYEESINKIISKLKETLPDMGKSLEDFLLIFENKGDRKKNIFWIAGTPIDVKDENLYVEIPKECSQEPIQTVVRLNNRIKRYYYNSEAINELSLNKDELSWLLIHEWLRDYENDTEIIRFLNAYLHSDEFMSDDEISVEKNIKDFKLNGAVWIGRRASIYKKVTQEIKSNIELGNKFMVQAKKLIDQYQNTSSRRERNKIQDELRNVRNKIDEVRSDLYGLRSLAFSDEEVKEIEEAHLELSTVYNLTFF